MNEPVGDGHSVEELGEGGVHLDPAGLASLGGGAVVGDDMAVHAVLLGACVRRVIAWDLQ